MVATSSGRAVIDDQRWTACTKAHSSGRNWLVPEEHTAGSRGRCLADSLIRREPPSDDTIAVESWRPRRSHCAGARWWAAFGPLPLIAAIWAVQAWRHDGLVHIREFLAEDVRSASRPSSPG